MPLDREHVTTASQIMLPTYLVTYLLLGLAFLLQDPARTSTPVFAPAKVLMPVQGWGIVFFAIAAYEGFALMRHHRGWEIAALGIGCGMAGFWATLLLVAAFRDTHVSYTSGTWLLIPVAAHFASMMSLARREGAR